jgi:hypothetical protein
MKYFHPPDEPILGKLERTEEEVLRLRRIVLLVFALNLISACGGGPSPSTAVEKYLESLIAGDQVGAVNASCADWEAQARAEAASFDSVEARLEGVSCSVSGEDGNISLVDCQGVIIATYGAEDTELPLEGRSYQIIQEGGDWRMCGYQ